MRYPARPCLGMHLTVSCWQVQEDAPPGRTSASGLCPRYVRIHWHAHVCTHSCICARARVHEHAFAPDLGPRLCEALSAMPACYCQCFFLHVDMPYDMHDRSQVHGHACAQIRRPRPVFLKSEHLYLSLPFLTLPLNVFVLSLSLSCLCLC